MHSSGDNTSGAALASSSERNTTWITLLKIASYKLAMRWFSPDKKKRSLSSVRAGNCMSAWQLSCKRRAATLLAGGFKGGGKGGGWIFAEDSSTGQSVTG